MTPLSYGLLFVFMLSGMTAIGLQTTWDQIFRAMEDRGRLLRVLLANVVLMPALGLTLVSIFTLPEDVEIALLLLSIAPGGANAIQFTKAVKDDLGLEVGLQGLLTLVALVVTPLLAALLLPLEFGAAAAIPYLRVIGAVTVLLLGPLLLGMSVRRRAPTRADVLVKVLMPISTLTFIASVLVAGSIRQAAANSVGASALAATAILLLGGMVIGWWLGGPSHSGRRIVAVDTSMRNALLCLAIAVTSFPDRNVDVAVLAYLAIAIFPNLAFTVYHGVMAKRRQATPPPPTRTR